jgi:hypothetical protein
MSQLVNIVQPIELILNACSGDDMMMKGQFEMFRIIFDYCAKLCREKRLQFVVKRQGNFDLDAGSCNIFEEGAFDKVLKVFKRVRRYKIILKKLTIDVLIHEVGHMLEKELNLDLNMQFKQAIKDDMDAKKMIKSIEAVIKDVMFEQVKLYPAAEQVPEVFARYFELLANCHEISGKASGYGFLELCRAFSATSGWINDKVIAKLATEIPSDISAASKHFVRPIAEIKHHWANDKVNPIHESTRKPKWSTVIKSIKDSDDY